MREAADDSPLVQQELLQNIGSRTWNHTQKVVDGVREGSQSKDIDLVRACIMPLVYEVSKGVPADKYDVWVRDMDDLFNDCGFDEVAAEIMKGMKMFMHGDSSPMQDFDDVVATSANHTQTSVDMLRFECESTGVFGEEVVAGLSMVAAIQKGAEVLWNIFDSGVAKLLASFIIDLVVLYVRNRNRMSKREIWRMYRRSLTRRDIAIKIGWNIAFFLVATYFRYPIIGTMLLVGLGLIDYDKFPSVWDVLRFLRDPSNQLVLQEKAENQLVPGSWTNHFRHFIMYLMENKRIATGNGDQSILNHLRVEACGQGQNWACNALGFKDQAGVPAAQQLQNTHRFYEWVRSNKVWAETVQYVILAFGVLVPLYFAVMVYDDTIEEVRRKIVKLFEEAGTIKIVATENYLDNREIRQRAVQAFHYMRDNVLLDMHAHFTVENMKALEETDWQRDMKFFKLQDVINSLLDDLETLKNTKAAIDEVWFRQLCRTRSQLTPLLYSMQEYLTFEVGGIGDVELGDQMFNLREAKMYDPCNGYYPDPANPNAGLPMWVVDMPPEVVAAPIPGQPDAVFSAPSSGGPAAAAAAAPPVPAGLGIWAAAAAAAAPGAAPAAAGSPDAEVDEEEGYQIDSDDIGWPGQEGGGYPEDPDSTNSQATISGFGASLATVDAAVLRREVLRRRAVSNAPTVDAAFAKLGM